MSYLLFGQRPGLLCLAGLFAGALAGCKPGDKGDEAPVSESTPPTPSKQGPTSDPNSKKPSAKEVRRLLESLPSEDEVQKIVNKNDLAPYAGPTGSVAGIVFATGDPPTEETAALKKIEPSCQPAEKTFGKLFREGPERQLADVLVAVTHYKGYVPEEDPAEEVIGRDCAWSSRTIAMTFGQALTIRGADARAYAPELLGQPMPAQLFVLPTAPPVQLPPGKPGRFKLVDSVRLFNQAEVFVLPYATHTVTRLDGRFSIPQIPVGKARVSVFLPQTKQTAQRDVEIKADKTIELEFKLPFDAAAFKKTDKRVPLDEIPGPEE